MINFIYSLLEFSCISWGAAFSGTFIIPVPDCIGVVIRSSVVCRILSMFPTPYVSLYGGLVSARASNYTLYRFV